MIEKERIKMIVVPGELVTEERKKLGQHVFVEEGMVYSDCLGIVYPESDIAQVVPLQGKYFPRQGDLIVGIVVNEIFAGYIVDINSFCYSFVPRDMAREELKRGSVISAKIIDVNEINEADLDDVRGFFGGEVIEVSPVKIPRIVGKDGSMLNVVKMGTNSTLIVGRNGRIWMKGGNTKLATMAIKKIEKEAHLSNLTSAIEDFLKKENKVN